MAERVVHPVQHLALAPSPNSVVPPIKAMGGSDIATDCSRIVTGAPLNSTINLPTLSGNASYSFYMQVDGTQGTLIAVVLFGTNRIHEKESGTLALCP